MHVDWDGRRLRIEVDDVAQLAIDVDGVFFDRRDVVAGVAEFRFPCSPSGRRWLSVAVRAGRDGALLTSDPIVIVIGTTGVADVAPNTAALPALLPTDADGLLPYGNDAMAQPVAVVVPVYNAVEAAEACIESVLRHTQGRWRLIVIDDASTDLAVGAMLARYSGRHGISVLRNDVNRGFTATANRGIQVAGNADVVLLNADAQVSANWLVGLRRVACSRVDVASVTAVSDNAGAFSVPELEQVNGLPPGWSFDDAARTLWNGAGLAYPALPTGNGFCMYLRRAAIDAVGMLDEAAFPQGYGEENDWSQRAEAVGWLHLVAGNVLVRHLRSQSFGDQRRQQLGEAGMAVLRQRWPGYEAAVGATLWSFERRVLDWRVRRLYAMPSPTAWRHLWLGDRPPTAAPTHGSDEIWYAIAADGCLSLFAPIDGEWRIVTEATAQVAGIAATSAGHRQALWDWTQRFGFTRIVNAAVEAHPVGVTAMLARLGVDVFDDAAMRPVMPG